jgi:hypothetical protein
MTELCSSKANSVAQRQTKLTPRLITLAACLFVGLWAISSACLADDLFVGNFFGPGQENILQYNATTGVFIGQFGPAVSFPWEPALDLMEISMSPTPIRTLCSVLMAPLAHS